MPHGIKWGGVDLGEDEPSGAAALNAAYDGAKKLAAEAADVMRGGDFTAAAQISLKVGNDDYLLSLGASVFENSPQNNQIKAELTKNSAVYLGIYLFDRALYIDAGEGPMKYSVLGDGSGIAPDLAALISSLPEKITMGGEQLAQLMDEKFEQLQGVSVSVGGANLEILDLILGFLPTQTAEDGSVEISGVDFPLIFGLAGSLQDAIGIDFAAFDEVVEMLLGHSFTEITSEGFDKTATPLADIRIGLKNDENGRFERAWIKRTFGEENFELQLSGVKVSAGGENILDAEKFSGAPAGAVSLEGRSYIGTLEVFTDVKISLDLNSNSGNKILITGGSAQGKDDYFTVAYDGAALISAYYGDENVNDDSYGNLVMHMSAAFCDAVGFYNSDTVLEEGKGFTLYLPAFDVMDLIDTLEPIISQLTGGTAAAALAGEEAPAQGGFDIAALMDRLILTDGIGINVDAEFIESMAGIEDLLGTVNGFVGGINGALKQLLGVQINFENLITKLLGEPFGGKTAAQIVDALSADVTLSLAEDKFGLTLNAAIFDKTADGAQVSDGSFTLGFAAMPEIPEKLNGYSVDADVEEGQLPLIKDGIEWQEEDVSLAIAFADKGGFKNNGNLQYYMSAVGGLLSVVQMGGFI